jgi:hypothetical protein
LIKRGDEVMMVSALIKKELPILQPYTNTPELAFKQYCSPPDCMAGNRRVFAIELDGVNPNLLPTIA